MDNKLLNKLLLCYIFFSLIFPNIRIKSFIFRSELILSLVILFVYFLLNYKKKDFLFKIDKVILLQLLYFLYSLIVLLFNKDSLLNFDVILLVNIYSIFRVFVVCYLFYKIYIDKKYLNRIFLAIIIAGISNCFLSILQTLGNQYAQKITLNYYSSPWRSASIILYKEYGRVIRSTGVFETPPFNALFILFFIAFIMFFVENNNRFKKKFILFIAITAGITTLTSTFLVGFFILNILLVIVHKKFYKKALFNIISFFSIIILILNFGDKAILSEFKYQISKIENKTLFESRYEENSGLLIDAIKFIKKRPLFGYGIDDKAFSADSLYVYLAYQSGIIGLLLFLLIIFYIIKNTIRYRHFNYKLNRFILLLTIMLLITGVGIPSFFILRFQEIYWGMIGFFLRKNKNE